MRRALSIFALFCVFAIPAQAKDVNLDEGRAVMAVNIFAKACFMNMGDLKKTEDFLNAQFQKHDDAKKQPFLDFTRSRSGDVWLASAAQGIFAIVLSDNGNCHVVAKNASRDGVHYHMANLAKQATENLDSTIRPHDITTGSATRSSGFDVVGPDDKNLMVVVASTPIEQSLDKPDTVITMAISSY